MQSLQFDFISYLMTIYFSILYLNNRLHEKTTNLRICSGVFICLIYCSLILILSPIVYLIA